MRIPPVIHAAHPSRSAALRVPFLAIVPPPQLLDSAARVRYSAARSRSTDAIAGCLGRGPLAGQGESIDETHAQTEPALVPGAGRGRGDRRRRRPDRCSAARPRRSRSPIPTADPIPIRPAAARQRLQRQRQRAQFRPPPGRGRRCGRGPAASPIATPAAMPTAPATAAAGAGPASPTAIPAAMPIRRATAAAGAAGAARGLTDSDSGRWADPRPLRTRPAPLGRSAGSERGTAVAAAVPLFASRRPERLRSPRPPATTSEEEWPREPDDTNDAPDAGQADKESRIGADQAARHRRRDRHRLGGLGRGPALRQPRAARPTRAESAVAAPWRARGCARARPGWSGWVNSQVKR